MVQIQTSFPQVGDWFFRQMVFITHACSLRRCHLGDQLCSFLKALEYIVANHDIYYFPFLRYGSNSPALRKLFRPLPLPRIGPLLVELLR